MTDQRTPTSDQFLVAWFEDGPTAMPDRVIDVVADRIGHQRQRRPWRLLGRPLMNSYAKLGLAAAALATVVLVGYSILPRTGPGPVGPTPSPTAAPTTASTVAPTVAPFGPADALAFTQAENLWVSKADGSDPHQLTTGGGVGAAAWSPDGDLLAYDQNGALYTLDATGTARQIAGAAGAYYGPSWSPDGTTLVAMASNGFAVVALDGTVREITEAALGLCVSGPDWGPGGDIVFSGNNSCLTGGESTSLYLMDASGSNVRVLYGHGTQVLEAAWSPDGSTLAYMDTAGGGCIYLIDADGTNPRRLTTGCTKSFKITWSPDGSRIAWAGGAHGPALAKVINIDGTGVQPITGLTSIANLDWRPTGGQ